MTLVIHLPDCGAIMGACPNRDELEQLLAGRLTGLVEETVCDHVEGCLACQHLLDQLAGRNEPRGLSAQLRAAPPETEDGFIRHLKQNPPAATASWGPGPERAQSRQAPLMDRPSATAGGKWPELPGYEILTELGRGGMGVVYKARQIRLNRMVAVKTILAGAHAAAHDRARFQVEAEAAAGLQHPNIVQVFEVGEHDGKPFLAMEYIEGGTLSDRLQGRPQQPRETAALIETLARAVHYAHERGIVHRDLKPANILLQNQSGEAGFFGTPKIADFGLAKVLSGEIPYTHTGVVLGTPEYMAPEQAAAKGQAIGPGCDTYALGVQLYELLTGRVPFAAASPFETLLLVRNEEPLPVGRLQPRVPHDLQVIAHKCLEKEPGRRYATARDLADDLRRFLDDLPIRARPPSLLYQWMTAARRHRGLVGGVAAVMAALVLGVVIAAVFAVGEARQRAAADAARHEADRGNYLARVSLAARTLEDLGGDEVARQLDAAPATWRNWEWSYLRARLDESLASVSVPTRMHDWVLGLPAFYPPGERVVGCLGRQVWLVDARTGVRLRRLPDADRVLAVQTRSGPLLFLDQDGGPLTLVDEDGRTQRTFFESGKRTTYGVAASADGRRLAVTWNLKDQERAHPLVFDLTAPERKPKVVLGAWGPGLLTLSSDGRKLGISSDESRVIDLESDQELWFGQGHKVFIFAISPDGRRIVASATGGADLRQIDLATGAVVDVHRGHKGDVACVAYSPDGRWLASGARDRTVRLWSLESGEFRVLHGHGDDVRAVAFTADGARLASLGEQGEARLWDLRGPGVLRGHTSYVYSVAFSPDGRWLASGGWDKTVRLWDNGTGAPMAALAGHDLYVSALAVHPDGTRLASLGADYSLRVWDTGGERQGRVFARGPGVFKDLPHQIQFSPDGSRLAVGDHERVRLWDAATLQEHDPLPVRIADVRQVLYSPNGRRLAVGGAQEVVILDAATGREELAVRLEHQITAVAFTPDGRRVLAADDQGEAHLLDVASGDVLATLRGHVGEIFAAVFHPNGDRLATAGRDRTIRLWDVARGEEVLKLTGHTDYVFGLSWSPDGATLASASGDHTVRLWTTRPVRQ